ncbi:hypothetical protein R70331_26005 [Paenibacillus sp. FSL R7-0331]|nr:hypothetical protein R70331_26005 [Paenibacillus sp. FSL R7-0331]
MAEDGNGVCRESAAVNSSLGSFRQAPLSSLAFLPCLMEIFRIIQHGLACIVRAGPAAVLRFCCRAIEFVL